jgi:hypothetical protein
VEEPEMERRLLLCREQENPTALGDAISSILIDSQPAPGYANSAARARNSRWSG